MKRSNLFIFFITIILVSSSSLFLGVYGLEGLYNVERTPTSDPIAKATSIEFECDAYPYPDVPERTISSVRLFYDVGTEPSIDYFNMANTAGAHYSLTKTSVELGASDGEQVYWFIKMVDSESWSDQSSTFNYWIIDETPPSVGEVYTVPATPDNDGNTEFCSDITDNKAVDSGVAYYKREVAGDGWATGEAYEDDIAGENGALVDGTGDKWYWTETDELTYDYTYHSWINAKDEAGNWGGDFWADEVVEGNRLDFNEGVAEAGLSFHNSGTRSYDGSHLEWHFNPSYTYQYLYIKMFDDYAKRIDCTDYDIAVLRFRIIDTNDVDYKVYWSMSSNAVDYFAEDCDSGYILNCNEADGWITAIWDFPDSHGDCDVSAVEKMRIQIRENGDGNFDSSDDYIEIDSMWLARSKQFTVSDGINPTLSNPDHTPDPPDENDAITFYVDCSDTESGIKAGFPKVYYQINDGGFTAYSMTLDAGSTYKYTTSGTFDYNADVDYYFYCEDNDGNEVCLYDYMASQQSDAIDFREGDTENFSGTHSITNFEILDGSLIMEATTNYGIKPTGAGWGSESEPIWEYDFDFSTYTTFMVIAKANVSDVMSFSLDSYYGSASNPKMYFNLITSWTTFFYDISDFEEDEDGVMLWAYGSSSDIKVEIAFIGIINPYSFNVADGTNPVLNNPDHSPDIPKETQNIDFTIDATDAGIGLDTVLVYIKISSGSWTAYEMNYVSANQYKYTLSSASTLIGDSIQYYFWSNDTAGNEACLKDYATTEGDAWDFNEGDTETLVWQTNTPADVTCVDGKLRCVVTSVSGNDFYVKWNPVLYPVGTNYDLLIMRVKSNINAGIRLVQYSGDYKEYAFIPTYDDETWRAETSGLSYKTDMATQGIRLRFRINSGSLAVDDYFEIHYIFLVNAYSLSVTDQDDPTFTVHTRDPSGDIDKNDNVRVSMGVEDNGELDTKMIYWRIDEGSWSSADAGLTGWYYLGYFNELEFVEYYWTCNDTYGNEAQSSTYSFTVGDTTVPSIITDYYTPEDIEGANIGVDSYIYCTVTDISGLNWVRLYYYADNPPENWDYTAMVHQGEGLYRGLYASDTYNEYGQTAYYWIHAQDTEGNTNSSMFSAKHTFPIVDITAPTFASSCIFYSDKYDQFGTTFINDSHLPEPSDHVWVTRQVTDSASGIADVNIYYKINSGEWVSDNTWQQASSLFAYNFTNAIVAHGDKIYVKWYAIDNDANADYSDVRYMDFSDTTNPILSSFLYPSTVFLDTSYTVRVLASDTNLLVGVQFFYRWSDVNSWSSAAMSYNSADGYYDYILPVYSSLGRIFIYAVATDEGGNIAQSEIVYFDIDYERAEPTDPVVLPPVPIIQHITTTPAIIYPTATALLLTAISIAVAWIRKREKKKKKEGLYG